ncbi:MAG: hypothetical protein AB7H90_10100 [Alphaproteobacteria bacterium]
MAPMKLRPDIPKRLAATIRRVQEKITSDRQAILIYEKRIDQHKSRIAEYESDPREFATKYYSGHGVESYPVQTNISRNHSGIEYRQSQLVLHKENLRNAEAELEQVTARMLAEVANMRPSRGRVPWPKPLPTFERFRADTLKRWEREERAHEVRYARERAKYQRWEEYEDARLAKKYERESQQAAKEISEWLAQKSPEERQAIKDASEEFLESLKTGRITFAQVLEYLQNRS